MLGQTILHYRIVRKLGSGGMGVVYEAEDTTLGRKVALKFLPDQAAKDANMLARLQREARAASALNHPNICTIYAVEQADGHFFISMELLEGMALDHLIAQKALTNEQIIDLGLQICDALDAAHSKGIVHRDIKPANIFVTDRKQVKILDFGLAKIDTLMAAASSADGQTRTNTSDLQLTHAGTTMGTIAYMSPEQARGEALDVRTDIFSFGVVLYQMATGKVPFEGNTSAIVFSKLLEHAPVPPMSLNPELHSQLGDIISKTLEKDRNLRYQTAADVAADLRRLKRDSGSRQTVSVAVQPAKGAPKSQRGPRVAIAALLLIGVLGAGAYWLKGRHNGNAASATAVNLTVLPLKSIGDASNGYLGAGVTKDIAARLAQLPQLHVDSPAGAGASTPGAVVSGTVVRSGDAVVVSMELADATTHQPTWSHQYTANTSELQALEGQIAMDLAEHAGVKLSWEDRRLQSVSTNNPDAYLEYLEARYDLDRNTPEDARRAADLLKDAVQKDANFTAAAAALAEVQKQFPPAPPDQSAADVAAAKATKNSPPTAGRQKSSATKVAVVPSPAPVEPPAPAPPVPEVGKIAVQSTPPGASIILDGKDTGKKTPAQVEASRGAHTIVLRQSGYLDSTANANINSSAETVAVSQTLVKLGDTKDIKTIGGLKKIFGTEAENMGRVRIETNPKGAQVTIGTQVLAKPTPVEFELNPGTYQVKLDLDGYEPLEKTIDISAGKRIQLKEVLTKK